MFFSCLPITWLLRHRLCHKLEWSTQPASGGSEERHCNLQIQRSKVLHTKCIVIQLLHRQRPAETVTTKDTKHFTKCFSVKPTVFRKHHLFTQMFYKVETTANKMIEWLVYTELPVWWPGREYRYTINYHVL